MHLHEEPPTYSDEENLLGDNNSGNDDNNEVIAQWERCKALENGKDVLANVRQRSDTIGSVRKQISADNNSKPKVTGRTALMEACEKGDLAKVREIAEQVTPDELNVQNILGSTALFEACKRGRYDIAEALLEYGAIPKAMTVICHIESVHQHDELLQHFLHSAATIPKELDATFVAIAIGRFCFLHHIGITARYSRALRYIEAVLTLRRQNGIDVKAVKKVNLLRHITESQRVWQYTAKRYGENTRWWLQKVMKDRDEDEDFRKIYTRSIKKLFPFRLQNMCRIAILKQLPVGFNVRMRAIEKLDLLPNDLQSYLMLRR